MKNFAIFRFLLALAFLTIPTITMAEYESNYEWETNPETGVSTLVVSHGGQNKEVKVFVEVQQFGEEKCCRIVKSSTNDAISEAYNNLGETIPDFVKLDPFTGIEEEKIFSLKLPSVLTVVCSGENVSNTGTSEYKLIEIGCGAFNETHLGGTLVVPSTVKYLNGLAFANIAADPIVIMNPELELSSDGDIFSRDFGGKEYADHQKGLRRVKSRMTDEPTDADKMHTIYLPFGTNLRDNDLVYASGYDTDDAACLAKVKINVVPGNAVGGSYYASFFNDKPYIIDQQVTVLDATLNEGKTALNESEVTYTKGSSVFPADKGVIINMGSAEYVTITDATGQSAFVDVTGNLEGVTEGTPQTEDHTYYVLSNSATNGLGYYKLAEGISLKAYKAYIDIPDTGSPKPEFIALTDVADETNGIATVAIRETVAGSNAIYDLSGRRVTSLAPGLYVAGGRKIVVK